MDAHVAALLRRALQIGRDVGAAIWGAVTGLTVSTTGTDGTANTMARSDHRHAWPQPPVVRVYNNASISIGDSSTTALTFNSNRTIFDANMHSTSSDTGRLVATVAGFYIIGATIRFASNATGIRQVLFRHSVGATLISSMEVGAASGAATDLNPITGYYLAANDYVECLVFQNSTGPLNVVSGANFSPEFFMVWVSP